MKYNFTDQMKIIGRGLPVWVQLVVRIPFIFLFVYEAFLSRCERQPKIKSPECQSVSIIIPTLNEEKDICPCIQSLIGNRQICEVIIVDGGSNDSTRMLAQKMGARVIVSDKPISDGGGRGGQIKAGISIAGGDVIAILHADSRLPGIEIDRMMDLLNRHPDVIGGAVGCRFDSPGFRFRLIELANDFRAAFLKISFGDQVQFFRRKPVINADLFPDIPLMEDVEFSIRLHRLGRRIYLFGSSLVSTRRWDIEGFKNAGGVFKQVLKYLIRRMHATPDTADLYINYYHS